MSQSQLQPIEPDVMTAREAADYLRVGYDKFMDNLRAGLGIPGRKLGGQWRFSKPALKAWLEHRPVLEVPTPKPSRLKRLPPVPKTI